MVDTIIAVYCTAELLLAVEISLSNLLVLWVYFRSHQIRTPTNAFIFSLALIDFLAGFIGIPMTVFSVLTQAPRSFLACLGVHIFMCILCTISIFHLLAIAIDKYITICCKCPLLYQRSRHARAMILIVMAWVIGTCIASLPLIDAFGFSSATRQNFNEECHFTVVVDYHYLVYVIFFGTIIIPSLIIVFCYASIYSRIRYEEKQIKCLLRASERQRRIHNRRKLIRILLILVVTYALCWYPLYLINTMDLYFPEYHSTPGITLSTVVLSHFGCAVNPLIYAYGMPGFKQALRRFFRITGSIGPGAYSVANRANSTMGNCSCLIRDNTMVSDRRKPMRTASYIPTHKRSHAVGFENRRKISEPPTYLTRTKSVDPLTETSILRPLKVTKVNGFEQREYFC